MNISPWVNTWNKIQYGWDLREIGNTLILVLDLNHWLVNKETKKFDEVLFAEKVEEMGVKAIIFKVSDANRDTGYQFIDWTADKWYKLTRKLGIIAGGYHWLQCSVDPKTAWNFYKSWMDDHPCELPFILDFEETQMPSATDIIWRAREWFGHANAARDDQAICYTGLGYIDTVRGKLGQQGKSSAQIKDLLLPFAQQPLWLALYSRYWPDLFVRKYMKYRIIDGQELWPWTNDQMIGWQYTGKADFPYWADGDNLNAQAWGFDSKGLDINYFQSDWLTPYLQDEPQIPPETPQPADPKLVDALNGWEQELNGITAQMRAFRESAERGGT